MSLAFLFHYLMFNMFRMLIHSSSVACDLFFELFHGLYCYGTMRVGVTLWFGWGGVVSGCRLKLNNEIKKQVTSSRSLFIRSHISFPKLLSGFDEIWYYGFPLERRAEIKIRAYGPMRNVIPIFHKA